MTAALNLALKALALLCGVALAGGWLGWLHPAGDSLAVFRLPLAVVFALAVIWTDWSRRVRWPLAGAVLALLAWHAYRGLPEARGDADLTLYQQNLKHDRRGFDAWQAALAAVAPDAITLQEVGARNAPILAALAADYPAQVWCPVGPLIGEAVLSRHPMVPGTQRCSQRDGIAAMQVETPEGRVWLVSLHVSWPWPHEQAQQLDQVLPDLRALDGPVIVAGDFNMVAWGHGVRRTERATQTRRIGQHVATFRLPGAGLPIGIDHVLAPPGTGRGLMPMPPLGSDHNGLVAFIRLAPG